MSWWVYLEDRAAEPWCNSVTKVPDEFGEVCTEPCYPAVAVDRFSEGGTQVIGGDTRAELNVTYNYSRHFRDVIDGGLGHIHEKHARDVIGLLEHAVAALGTDQSSDYWESTRGNAGAALAVLAEWARQHPDAVFRVS